MQLPVTDRASHSKSCQEFPTACPADQVGCDFKAPRKDLQQHVSNCALAKLAPYMQSMSSRIGDQQSEIRTLRSRNEILESSLVTMQRLVENLSSANVTRPDEALADLSHPDSTERDDDGGRQLENAPFDSASHHMLSLHESLREELDRVSAAISEVDGKASMTIINETLRIREDMHHQNAAISSLKLQLQWLMNARLQSQAKSPAGSAPVPSTDKSSRRAHQPSDASQSQQVRRSSDSSRGEVKL